MALTTPVAFRVVPPATDNTVYATAAASTAPFATLRRGYPRVARNVATGLCTGVETIRW